MKKKRFLHLFAIVVLISMGLHACKKGGKASIDTPTKPVAATVLATVETGQPTAITTTTATANGTVVDKGSSSVTEQGVVWGLKTNPTLADNKAGVSMITGAGFFTCLLTKLSPGTKYYLRAFAVSNAGIAYGNEISFTSTTVADATFNFQPMFIVGATVAAADIEVLSEGGAAVTERGICYAIVPNPTLANSKVAHGKAGTGKFRIQLPSLSPKTKYYARAYAINSKGVSYSDEVSFNTIEKGKITYTFNKSANPTSDELQAYARLQVAVDSAVWYLSNYTSATKHIYLNYVSGVPTADANNEGWMRFGTNSSYQNLRTMLHEMNHTLGTGTTGWWTGKIVGGKFQGQNVNDLLKKITADQSAQLNGDTQHWWPYGLNQNSEVSSSWDFVYNCIIIEAMRRDGLPTATSGAFNP
jgi:hypothetical protein